MDVALAVALSLLPSRSRARVLSLLRADNRRSGVTTLASLDAVLAKLHLTPEEVVPDALREEAHRHLSEAAARQVVALPWSDPAYPSLLAAIADPPLVLWCRGDTAALGAPAVAIVGSRAGSAYALEVAGQLATDLAERGVVVVSGLARGVDGAAHSGAIAGGGRTIAVLGCGADVVYPTEHRRLAQRVAGAGALVSEFPPGTPPRPGHFPLRNRIISGLALGVVVVEASEQSGSLITARCALEQGRDVMVVPGNVLSGRNRGSHALINDGARIIESAADIIDELRLPARPCAAVDDPSVSAGALPPLVQIMTPGETYDLDALVAQSGVSGPKLLPRLIELELNGWIRRAGGGRFMRAD